MIKKHYQKIWQKITGDGEEVKKEFSKGDRYIKISLIIWLIVAFFFFISEDFRGIGVLIALIVLFYYPFYLRVANLYGFTDRRVIIHQGWLSTRMISVDYDKVTDVSAKQGILEKILFKTGDIFIATAGTNRREVTLTRIQDPYQVKKELDKIRDENN
jgi:membrane protein YdbS with pleckstrin-like domain